VRNNTRCIEAIGKTGFARLWKILWLLLEPPILSEKQITSENQQWMGEGSLRPVEWRRVVN
jgi:hypothetical protein